MISYLDFEKPVAQLEERIAQLRSVNALHDVDVAHEIARLEAKSNDLLASTYASLTPWQKTQVARHPARPFGVGPGSVVGLSDCRHRGDPAQAGLSAQ